MIIDKEERDKIVGEIMNKLIFEESIEIDWKQEKTICRVITNTLNKKTKGEIKWEQ